MNRIGVYPTPEEAEYPEFEYQGEFNEKPLPHEDPSFTFEMSEEEREKVEVGLDLNNWRYAIMTPQMRQEVITHGIGIFSKLSDFWAVLQPIPGIDDPKITEVLDLKKPVRVIGPRPSMRSYADNYFEKAEDALYFIWELAQSDHAPEYKEQLLRGRIPPEVRVPLEELVHDLMNTTSTKEAIELHGKLVERYETTILQFRGKTGLYAYREANPRGPHPTNLIYSERTNMPPWEAAVAAHNDDALRYTLNLNELKRGVKTRSAMSFRNAPTRQVVYSWHNIIKHLVDYTDVIVVNADMSQLMPETKGITFAMIDEFTQLMRGMPTQLGKMLNDIKRLNYSGLIVIEMPPSASQKRELGPEITKTAIVIDFVRSHLNPEPQKKPVKPKTVL